MRYPLCIILLICASCVSDLRVGSFIHHQGAMFGGYYVRQEDDTNKASGDTQVWTTGLASTWGHRQMEFYVGMDMETASFDIKGVSDNLRAVMGDGFGIHAIDTALCGFIPTSCLRGQFVGDSNKRMDLIGDIMEGPSRDAFMKAVVENTRED